MKQKHETISIKNTQMGKFLKSMKYEKIDNKNNQNVFKMKTQKVIRDFGFYINTTQSSREQ